MKAVPTAARETKAAGPAAASTPVAASTPAPLMALAVAAVGLFLIAFFFALRVGRSIFLPLALAVVLNFLLAPLVRFLGRLRIPTVLGAGLVLSGFLVALAAGFYGLSGPASGWIQAAPQALQEVEWKLRGLREPMEQVERAAREVEEMAEGAEEIRQVAVEERRSLTGAVLGQTTQVLAGAGVAFFLLFFLLASGELFLRKLVSVLPRLSQRKKAVTIVRRTEREVSTFLFTMSLINTGLGAVVGVAMFLLGMPNPILWGVMAMFLNYVPYIGPLVGYLVVGLVALVTFDSLGEALLPPLVYVGLNVLEGNLVTPTVMGRELSLNPVVILSAVVFWSWLWGIPGAILAVPLLAIVKIAADNIDVLRPVGEFLGR